MLTNRAGSFVYFNTKSRFGGVFLKKGLTYKIIDRIELPNDAPKHNLFFVENHGVWWMPDGKDALVVQLDQEQSATLSLDCKELFDDRQWGREYKLTSEKGCVVVSFSKTNDVREAKGAECELFLAIAGAKEAKVMDSWLERKYSAEKESRWVYQAAKLTFKNAVFAFSTKKSEAINTAKEVFENRNKLFTQKQKRVSALARSFSVPGACAAHAVDALRVSDGVVAGLPLLPEFQTRDEIISVKSLLLMGDAATAKKVLWRYLERVPFLTKSWSDKLPIADGGWLFVRILDLLKYLAETNSLSKVLSQKDIAFIVAKLNKSVDVIFSEKMKDGLVTNKARETWMDSASRPGARIEINALTLAMLHAVHVLTGKPDGRELALKSAVRRAFLRKTLVDTPGGMVRPNLFIAAYVYPNLLSKAEWVTCFDVALNELWLDWGGIATISTESPDKEGEHNGDSWFWLNHIAAIVLHRFDATRYKKQIDAIISASSTIQRWNGGFICEKSSAAKLNIEGCPAYVLSNATFLELLEEVKQ